MAGMNLSAALNLDISRFVQNLKNAEAHVNTFAGKLGSKLTTAHKRTEAVSAKLADNYKEANKELRSHSLGLKDTARIVQGIIVSQTFYAIAGSIRDATRSLLAFNEQLDYAQVTFGALFGSYAMGTDLIKGLQEMSVESIFGYDTLAGATKKLLAYGIEAENVLYTMQGLINLGSMSGDAAALDRIALAMGQIQTTGYLTATEMRQLANAYVPIYDIIQQGFGLTGEQMSRVGDLRLPAEDVLNAIVEYADVKFGDVADAAMMTITGLKNRVVDTMKVMGSEMMMPLTIAWKSFLLYVSNGLTELRNQYNARGLAGVFESLVPDPAAQTNIRTFFANLHNLIKTVISVLYAAASVARIMGQALVAAFNVVGPPIMFVINLLANFVRSLTQNAYAAGILRMATIAAAAAFVVLRVHALGALVITAVTKAVTGLSKALLILSSIITKHPILMLIAALAVTVAGVAAASNNANNSLQGLFKTINGAGGTTNPNDIFKETTKEATDAQDQFNKAFEEGSKEAEKFGDSAGKAGKDAKKAISGLLSFDEVFKLDDKSDSGSGGGAGSYDPAAFAGLIKDFAGLGDSLIPEIPDFSDFISDFTDDLFGGLKSDFLSNAAVAGLGIMLARRILDAINKIPEKEMSAAARGFATKFAGALKGAFIGFAVDTVASLLTDRLWQYLEESLKLKEGSAEQASFAATFASVIGGAIGLLVGGIPGSLIGAAIGHLAGGIVGLAWDEIGAAFNNTIALGIASIARVLAKAFGGSFKEVIQHIDFTSLSTMFKSIGQIFSAAGLKSLAKGGALGLAIGLVTDAIAALLWKGLAEKFNLGEDATKDASVGQFIGGLVGTIAGLFFGPIGAAVGGVIGTFVGGLAGLFWDTMLEYFGVDTNALSSFFDATKNELTEWSVSTFAGFAAWASDTWGLLSGWFVDTFSGFTKWLSDTFGGFTSWFGDTFGGFAKWLSDTIAIFSDWDSITGDTLRTWIGDTISSLAGWAWDTLVSFDTWWKDTTLGFLEWAADTVLAIWKWAFDIIGKIDSWVKDTLNIFGRWYLRAREVFAGFVADVYGMIGGFFIAALKSWIDGWAGMLEELGSWLSKSDSKLVKWFGDTLVKLGGWLRGFGDSISTWFSDTAESVRGWWDGLWDADNWISGWTHVKDWFSDLWTEISSWFSRLATSVSSWWSSLFSNKKVKVTSDTSSIGIVGGTMGGHARGGIFNREHIARFAEGDKAEAVIPLENASAMQPFVDAISQGLIQGLAPTLLQVNSNNSNTLPPMYVGTLIADDRGIKQLYKKFEVIRVQEDARRGNYHN
jgi:tape measure domain-containing protein